MANVQDKSPNDVRALVNKQAEDEGLWFVAKYASEAYLQAALRELHAAIEQPPKATLQSQASRIAELERENKNLAPTGKYNGQDIEQWYQCAEKAEAQLAEARAKHYQECARICEEEYPEMVALGVIKMFPQFEGGAECAKAIRAKLTEGS